MDRIAKAADAATTFHKSGATGAGSASNPGSHASRQVSIAPAGERLLPSPRKRQHEIVEAGASGGAGPSVPSSKLKALDPNFGPMQQAAAPESATSTTEPPSGAKPVAGVPESLHGSPGAAEREALPRFTDLPWLSPDENAELSAANRRLRELLDRPDIPANRKEAVSAAFRVVTKVEQDIVRVDALLKHSGSDATTGPEKSTRAEKRELSDLVFSIRNNLSKRRGDWDAKLTRSCFAGLWKRKLDREAAQGLFDRHSDARKYFYSAEMPWQAPIRRFEIMQAARPHDPVVVESRTVPGWELGSRLAQGYPVQPSTGPYCPAWYTHVPGLANTVVSDADGQELYSGVRHGLIHASALGPQHAARLPGARLRQLVCASMRPERGGAGSDPSSQEIVTQAAALLGGRSSGKRVAETIAANAAKHMAMETVASALAADPAKLSRGLDGETVDLDLFSVPIVAGEDRPMYLMQDEAFSAMASGNPLPLPMLDQNGEIRTVSANIKFREFVFQTRADDTVRAYATRWDTTSNLLGGWNDPELGGDAGNKADAMKTRAVELRRECRALRFRYSQSVTSSCADHPQVRRMRGRLVRLSDESKHLESNARTLEYAAVDFKSALVGDRSPPLNAVQAHNRPEWQPTVVARLALAAHMMGGTPLLSCATGKDYVRQVESEIESLVTFAANHGGCIPMLGE